MKLGFLLYLGLTGLLSVAPALAWGPHSEITQAALDALSTNNALLRELGTQAQRLTNYCWMGDYHRVIFEEQNELFYADDYLLFPGATPQWEHFGPWLKTTFQPYFRRSLQALRTENPTNAARWIGALLHFVEDAGAPPHALAVRSLLHPKMENWVDTNAIHIPGYRPQLLGETEDKALAGLLQRMDKVNALATKHGKKLRLYAELGNRSGSRPLVLECALESSQAAADVLYTLGVLMHLPQTNSASLVGEVVSLAAPGLERFPAKVMFDGTNFSSLTDLAGRFEFHNLPPANYSIVALRPGGGWTRAGIKLEAGKTNICKLALAAQPANLIRNGDFK